MPLSGRATKFLCVILNSKLISWFVRNTAPTSGMGETQWLKSCVIEIPIPKPCDGDSYTYGSLVDMITQANLHNNKSEYLVLKKRLDHFVYNLYDLTDHEICVIETNV